MLRDLIRDRDGIFVSSGAAEPAVLLEELVADVAPARAGLELFQIMIGSRGRLGAVADLGHRVSTPVPGPLVRGVAEGRVRLLDLSLAQCAAAIADGRIPVDVALLTVVRDGERLWPLPATDLAMVAFERARARAVEVLSRPYATPRGPHVAAADVDYLVEADGPLPELAPFAPTAGSRRIGERVAELVPPGAVVQVGIGRALASVGECLAERGEPIGVHTGMASDWTRALVEAGVVEVLPPCANGGLVVAALALGSRAFSDWVASSGVVTFADCRHTHDLAHLTTLAPFVAVNSALAVDLQGQAGVPRGVPDVRGPAGLLDFAVAGTYAGRSIVALEARGRIVDELGTVHLPANLVSFVVTEHGVADLRGRSPRERRRALEAVAEHAG